MPYRTRKWTTLLDGRPQRVESTEIDHCCQNLDLRTSNPIESLFAGVRLRTDVAKRMRRRENALYRVFKIAQRIEHSWRPLSGGLTITTLLLGGARFVDGGYVSESLTHFLTH